MKALYTLRGTNYKDDIEYEFDNETITAKYITNGKVDAESTTLEKELAKKETIYET